MLQLVCPYAVVVVVIFGATAIGAAACPTALPFLCCWYCFSLLLLFPWLVLSPLAYRGLSRVYSVGVVGYTRSKPGRWLFFPHPCSRCREAWYHHVCIHVLFELAGSSLRRRQLASLVEKCMTSAAGVYPLRTTCMGSATVPCISTALPVPVSGVLWRYRTELCLLSPPPPPRQLISPTYTRTAHPHPVPVPLNGRVRCSHNNPVRPAPAFAHTKP